ncbi:MAG: response regulator, partial [Anaerolineae bacterium]
MNDQTRILVVDDDKSARRIMSLVLQKKGYEIDTAGDGREALLKARETFYNAALLDVRLPDCEGIELLAPLRELQPDLVSFVVTGYASLETAVEAVNQGAAGYITKPVDMERMVASIEDALERQRLIIENKRLLQQVQAELQERKKAEEARRQSESRFRLLVENAPIGILYATTDGDILTVNAKLLEILGSPSVDATRKFNIITFPRMVEAGISDDFQTCVRTGDLVISERQYISHWGKQAFFRYHFSPIRETSGEITAVQAIVEDITERRQAEEERQALLLQIRSQAQQMQETINAVPDGVFVLGAENRILLANPVAERHLHVLA